MSDLILPTIGSSGYFELRAPFDTIVVVNERYTCQAIRRISDYLANNEDVKADIYDKYQLPEAEFFDDSQKNMYIVSLQSEKGHWLYVPARYIVKYPEVNGIPYRTMMIGVSLPPMVADRDYSFVMTDIQNLVTDSLGVTPTVKLVETSRVLLVSKEKHDIEQANRTAIINGNVTDRSRYISTQIALDRALTKIQELEAYIKNQLP